MKKITVATLLVGMVMAAGWKLMNQPSVSETKMALAKAAKTKKGPKQDRPGEAAAYWAAKTETPNGENPALLNQRVKEELEARRGQRDDSFPSLRFEDVGPGNYGGRIRAMVVHENDPDILLVGGVSGGIWKTENGGLKWRPINDFMANLAISSMIVDPDDPDTVYVGTGEGFFNLGAMRGLGIFKSTDFGETWTHLDSTNGVDFEYVNRMARIPGGNVLLAATRTGVFRSGDLGLTWTEVSGIVTNGRGFVDLKLDPSDSDRVFAYHFGGSDGSNPELVVNTPQSIAGIYPATPANFGPSVDSPGLTGNLVLADDGAAPTSDACTGLVNAGAIAGNIALIDRGSCAFVDKANNAQDAGAIAVLVVNNISGPPVVMGGDDPGITIPTIMVSLATGDAIKAVLSQGVNVTMRLSDEISRGLMRSTDGGQNFSFLTADNGLPMDDLTRMELGIGTDGVIYVAAANNDPDPGTRGLYRSSDGGDTFVRTASTFPFIERQGWYNLIVGVDPSDSDRVYLGAIDVSRTTDAGENLSLISDWSPNPGQIERFVHADIHNIAFHPQDPLTLWIATDGGVYKSTDGGDNFFALNNNLRLSQFYGIAVHPEGTRAVSGTQDNGTKLFFGMHSTWPKTECWSFCSAPYSRISCLIRAIRRYCSAI